VVINVRGTDCDDACSDEGECNGNDVDGQLELEEFGDAVVNVAPPDDRFHNTREVIIHENDVGSFLRHIRTSDTLQ